MLQSNISEKVGRRLVNNDYLSVNKSICSQASSSVRMYLGTAVL